MSRFVEEMTGGVIRAPAARAAPKFRAPANIDVPAYMDVAQYLTVMENQGATSKCVDYAIREVVQGAQWQHLKHKPNIPEGKIYERSKQTDGFPQGVKGTTEEAGIRSAIELEYLPVGTKRHAVNTLNDLKQAMHCYMWVVGAFYVFDGWNRTECGKIRRVRIEHKGLHEVVFAGYMPDYVVFGNSWGRQWGDDGFGYIDNDLFAETFDGGTALEINW